MSENDKKTAKLVWDDSKMEMSYANVCNVSSTKEEFNLLFGTNQTWTGIQKDIRVSLSNRIILNPYAAKRMAIMLTRAVQQYEEKVAPIKLDTEHMVNSGPEGEKH